MHFAIVEDQEADRLHLERLIRDDFLAHGTEIDLSVYAAGEDFLHDFRRGFCSAVFLDIMLAPGGLTGIETARRLRETDARVPIVFTTTEADFAMDGYAVHPLDYLLKPVGAEKLAWCLTELREYLEPPAFIEVQESVGQGAAAEARPVLLDELICAETLRHGVVLHTTAGDIPARQTLSELVQLLPKNGRFYPSGRGLLVNFSHVESIGADGGILMKDGGRFYCSRRRIRETKAAFSDYVFASLRKGGAGQ